MKDTMYRWETSGLNTKRQAHKSLHYLVNLLAGLGLLLTVLLALKPSWLEFVVGGF